MMRNNKIQETPSYFKSQFFPDLLHAYFFNSVNNSSTVFIKYFA